MKALTRSSVVAAVLLGFSLPAAAESFSIDNYSIAHEEASDQQPSRITVHLYENFEPVAVVVFSRSYTQATFDDGGNWLVARFPIVEYEYYRDILRHEGPLSLTYVGGNNSYTFRLSTGFERVGEGPDDDVLQ